MSKRVKVQSFSKKNFHSSMYQIFCKKNQNSHFCIKLLNYKKHAVTSHIHLLPIIIHFADLFSPIKSHNPYPFVTNQRYFPPNQSRQVRSPPLLPLLLLRDQLCLHLDSPLRRLSIPLPAIHGVGQRYRRETGPSRKETFL